MKNIIWDFDGVILDSMPIRTQGFAELFKKHDERKVQQLLEYHEEQGGLSRYHKIRYFYEKIVGLSITETQVNELAQKFSDIMLEQLGNAELLIADSVNWIKDHSRKYRFFIASGSDQAELRVLVERLGLKEHFEGVYGSPVPKIENVAKILSEYQLEQSETCLIGDSINDREAAEANAIRFYGYNNLKLTSDKGHYIKHFSTHKFL